MSTGLEAAPLVIPVLVELASCYSSVTTHGGDVLEHHAPYRKGDPEAPLSDADLNDKFAELAGPVLGGARMQALRDAVWRLDAMPVRALRLAADMPKL